jgi:hypothetical protein
MAKSAKLGAKTTIHQGQALAGPWKHRPSEKPNATILKTLKEKILDTSLVELKNTHRLMKFVSRQQHSGFT